MFQRISRFAISGQSQERRRTSWQAEHAGKSSPQIIFRKLNMTKKYKEKSDYNKNHAG